ncbi:uncharacterized protein LOC144625249 [Crassostrea virginica]
MCLFFDRVRASINDASSAKLLVLTKRNWTTVDLYMYTVVLQKMFPLQTLHRSDAAHLTFRVTANRLSGYMEDPLTSDFIESSVSSLCTGIRGRLYQILTVTVRRSINW